MDQAFFSTQRIVYTMQIYYKKYYVLIKCFKFMGMDSNQELHLVQSFF